MIIVGHADELGIDASHVQAFFAEKWPRDVALEYPEFYQWNFKATPGMQGKDRCLLAIDDESEALCGVLGLNERPFSVSGQTKTGAEITSWMVDEAYRHSSAGAQMLFHLKSNYDIYLGMGISALALPLYLMTGAKYLRCIPRYLKVFDSKAIQQFVKIKAEDLKLIQRMPAQRGVRFLSSDVNEALLNRANEANLKMHHAFVRDAAWVKWRYQKHPVFDYLLRVVSTSDGEHRAVVVFRLEDAVEGLRVLHVLDLYGDKEAFTSAIAFVESYCRDTEIHLADFYCVATSISACFIQAGWLSIEDHRFFQFPHLFHPLELRDPPSTSMIYWGPPELSDLGRFYITKQDADLDRPTGQTMEKQKGIEHE